MLNEVKLQEGHPVDENLRPLKVGGKATAIELAQHGNGARVTGDLEANVNQINEQNFGYVLFPFNNLNKVLLNIYDSKQEGEYDWHYDSSRSDLLDTKLTILINLSEKYEGGELKFFQGIPYTVKEFTPGTLLLFKSYIHHRVTPVTKGVRKTLTLFCNGPKFR